MSVNGLARPRVSGHFTSRHGVEITQCGTAATGVCVSMSVCPFRMKDGASGSPGIPLLVELEIVIEKQKGENPWRNGYGG